MSQWGRTKCCPGPGFHCATSDATTLRASVIQIVCWCVCMCAFVCASLCVLVCVFASPRRHKKSSWSISGLPECDSSVPGCGCDAGARQTPALRHEWRSSETQPQRSRDEHVRSESGSPREPQTQRETSSTVWCCVIFHHSPLLSDASRLPVKKEDSEGDCVQSRCCFCTVAISKVTGRVFIWA